MTAQLDEIVARVKQALESNTPQRIIGGGSKAGMLGRSIDDPTLQTIELSVYKGIVDYHPDELVLTAKAGTRISDINAALKNEGQMLSFEPPNFGGKATIGGTLACNMSGPARPWAGSTRDAVLGLQLINGRAELLNFGGQVMKNVAGYDVSRLQAGALGTLGIITEVSLKVMPLPEHTLTLAYELTAHDALALMNTRSGDSKPLSAAAWVDGQLFLRLSGAEQAVSHTAKLWGGEQADNTIDLWREIREFQHSFFAGDAPLWRFSQRPNAPIHEPFGNTFLDWGGAQRWVRGGHQWLELQQAAERAGGHVSLFRGGDRANEVKHTLDGVEKTLHQRLKYAFDPQGIFNPGQLYSWM